MATQAAIFYDKDTGILIGWTLPDNDIELDAPEFSAFTQLRVPFDDIASKEAAEIQLYLDFALNTAET